jgi:protein ImuA
MQVDVSKKELAKQLQAQINAMQGLGKLSCAPSDTGFLPFANAFPEHVFPTAAIHEFVSYEPAEAASTSGFITALAGKFMKSSGLCLWIGSGRKIFPSALKHFGLEPDRVIFIDPPKQRDTLWIIEEALKCESVTAVIGDIKQLTFTDSRRLQLAVENSGVTGFVHRYQPYAENAVACTTRWRIIPLPSMIDGLPGVGHSCWDVQLLKVKNGRPDSWKVRWTDGHFITITDNYSLNQPIHNRYAG